MLSSMNKLTIDSRIGVLGAGAMGGGIAQVAATFGHKVILTDADKDSLFNSKERLNKILNRLVEKESIQESRAKEIIGNIKFAENLNLFKRCNFVIEAIVEDLKIKQDAFRKLEKIIDDETVISTNTSSLSVTSIASACRIPERVIGIHFFNPTPLMPLVEIIPGLKSADEIISHSKNLMTAWGKIAVVAKDTPGFIVNRVARPFYGEALRILEEGIADVSTIDWAMKEIGGFRMGPFELMDLIGIDVNYKVTESIFKSFFCDPRFKPSFIQKRLVEAGYLGKKSGRGFYDYSPGFAKPEPKKDKKLGEEIFLRILSMLINEAADAVFLKIATVKDIDLAMTKGVNYPKGLLKWADEIGVDKILFRLIELYEEYGEDRYRPNPLLKRMVREHKSFY